MMSRYLYLKKKNDNLKKEKEVSKTNRNFKKLKNYNNKIVKNYYHRVKEFINEMEKKPVVINNFHPLNDTVKKMTYREKNFANFLVKQNFPFLKSKTLIGAESKFDVNEDLNILFNNNKINKKDKVLPNLKKDKELKILVDKYKKINKDKKKIKNLSNNLPSNKTLNIKSYSNNKLKKTYFESVITLMYKNKDILYHNKINNEEINKKKEIYKKSNKLSERIALNVLVKCNKFNQKYINLNTNKKPLII